MKQPDVDSIHLENARAARLAQAHSTLPPRIGKLTAMIDRPSFWLFAAVALLWLTPALAADLPLRRKPVPDRVNVFVPPDATCMEWTDGCRTCQKPPAGEATCSNVGIACVSEAVRCTRR